MSAPALVDTMEQVENSLLPPRAENNGQPVPILRANAILRSVYLEPGEHRVELVYRPRSVQAGVAVAAVTTVALLGAGGAAWARQRRSAARLATEKAEGS